MAKDDRVYLRHMLDALGQIGEYTDRHDRKSFLKNRQVQDATIRQLEILGEAVKQVSGKLRAQHREVPWADIAGMRDKLIHDYLGVDLTMVWLTVQQDLPTLKASLQDLLASLPASPDG